MMLPMAGSILSRGVKIAEPSSRTLQMDMDRKSISGYTDKLEAMRQAVYLVLNIERFRYVVFSWNYGIETLDLYGQPHTYVIPELERRITEALMQDTRITEVKDFSFHREKNKITAAFTVKTIYGEINSEKEVAV